MGAAMFCFMITRESDMLEFIPGLKLSGMFYEEVVQPILTEAYPGLDTTAALIGAGSEVLGFDTPMSRDHDWGPRLFLFLSENDAARVRLGARRQRDHAPQTTRRRKCRGEAVVQLFEWAVVIQLDDGPLTLRCR